MTTLTLIPDDTNTEWGRALCEHHGVNPATCVRIDIDDTDITFHALVLMQIPVKVVPRWTTP